MAKYLLIGSYSAVGAKGLMAKGGSARREAARRSIESVGGTLEAYYFGFGKDDAYVLFDAPSHAAASALSLTASQAGGFSGRVIVLITPEEIDEASRLHPEYSPPGS